MTPPPTPDPPRPRWWEIPNLFDLVGGALLDKSLLARGVRTGSLRRYAIVALIVRLYLGSVTWEEVVAWTVAIVGLDLAAAITAAPRAALQAIGAAVGAAAGRVRGAYGYASAWSDPYLLPNELSSVSLPDHPEDPDAAG